MPELPEVETTKASLSPLLGQVVESVRVYQSKLRWPIPKDIDALEGYSLTRMKRRAKYLILEFSRSINSSTALPTKSLLIHLGMSGSLQQLPLGSEKRKHDHLIIQFSTRHHSKRITQLHYHDPRRFGAVLWFDDYSSKLLDHLGPEPLSDTFNAAYLYNRIHRIENNKVASATELTQSHQAKTGRLNPITRPIKSIIMDQVFVVGVGNIYATESLFLTGIHPNTPANLLSKAQLHTLVDHIKAILKRAIDLGGSTLRDFTVASGTTGYFQQTLKVYGRHKDPCPVCATPIDKVTINGRASTFCPNCQPLILNHSISLD